MAEVLVPADAEKNTLDELSLRLPPLGYNLTTAAKTVGTRIPTANPKPVMFVRVMTTGGARRDLVTDNHTVVVEGWALREQDARDLTALSVAIVESAARAGTLGGRTCYGASATVPANLPHPDVPTHFRFTSTVTVALRRVTA